MLKLGFENGRFTVQCSSVDNFIPRSAGFVWNRKTRVWETPFSLVAKRIFHKSKTPTIVGEILAERETTEERLRYMSAAAAPSDATFRHRLPCPTGLEVFDFQAAGVEYITNGDRRNCLIADEMGVGKTIETILALNYWYAEGHKLAQVLVLCPASLKINWKRELEKWLTVPLSVGIASGKIWPDTNIIVMNYELLVKNHKGKVMSRVWDVLICDEAHYLKNPKALRTKSVVDPDNGIKAKRKLLLTGTPILNRPIELWPLLKYLEPSAWPSYMDYAKRYCAAHMSHWGWDFTGACRLDELQYKLRSIGMLRRLKKDVLHQLPPKFRQIIELEPDPAGRKMIRRERELLDAAGYGDDVMRMTGLEGVPFEEMAKVRHDTAMAKLPQCLAHLQSLLDSSGDKIVVFAHHHDVIDAVRDKFEQYGVACITGNTPASLRQLEVDRFQTDEMCRLFVGNIGAAGVGITLAKASMCVFFELPWTPGEANQCEDRLHRIGQMRSVVVQHVVLNGSLDARMAQTIVEKQRVIDAAVDLTEYERLLS